MRSRCPNGEGIQIVHMLKDLPDEGSKTMNGNIDTKETTKVESVGA